MSCSHARTVLYPQPDRAERTIESAAALAHLRECTECRQYFKEQRAGSLALKNKLERETAPLALREWVTAEMEKYRRASPARQISHPRLIYAAVAVLLATVVPLLYWADRLQSERFFEDVCTDHAKYLAGESQLRSSDPSVLASWFHDKTGFGVQVPRYEDVQLLGSRLCFLKRHKAALVLYRKGSHPVSLFEMSAEGVNLSALRRSVVDGMPVFHKSFEGYSLVAFERRGVLWVLVSDLHESDLLPLASVAWHQF